MFHLFVLLDLHHFLSLVTGTPYLTSKGISVDFTSTDYDPPVAIHTCAQSIMLGPNNLRIIGVALKVGEFWLNQKDKLMLQDQ